MLELFLPWLAVIAVAGALFTLGMRRSASRALERLGRKHQAADTVVNEGRVPEWWIERDRRRLENARRNGASAENVEKLGERAHKHAMKEFSRLERYLRKTTLVEDEESRALILESMEKRRSEWEVAGWREILQGAPSGSAHREG